jgi:spore germination protein YaaH
MKGMASFRTAIALLALVAGSARASTRLTVSAWLPTNWDLENTMTTFRAHAGQIHQISPVWYWLKDDGGVLARLPGGKSGCSPEYCETEVVALCRRYHIQLIPLISNSRPGHGFDPDLVGRIVSSDAFRAAHIRALTTVVMAHGYDGIEIDYELLHDKDRDGFSRFMRELADSLHAQGKLLAIAAHPKIEEPGGDWGPGAQDYAALGQAVDYFRIMTYDHHWSTGPAGPLAPLPWYKEVLKFAAARIPAKKIQMGIPTYGYDWTGTWTGKSDDISPRDAAALARAKHATICWDPTSNECHFTYPVNYDEHQVWYEDADCLPLKLAAAREAGVGGIAIWRLGTEEPAFWDYLAGTRTPPHRVE